MTATATQTTPRYTVPPRYIGAADCAKLMRAALKQAFPGVKFGVRTHSYSMGASVRITWMDGPTSADVERIARQFTGASFDGMIDLKSYHDSTLNGERVHYHADYVFCDRFYSVEFAQRIADEVAEKWGCPWVTITASDHEGYPRAASFAAAMNVPTDGNDIWTGGQRAYDLADRIHQEISQRPYTPPAATD